MSELADLWSDRPERERRKAAGTAELSREVPDRVIDAPIPDEDIRGFLATLKDASPAVLKAIAVFHRKRAMVAEAKCARLEAEKQDARTEGWNDCVDAAAGVAYSCLRCTGETRQMILDLAKPTAAKQGDAS